VNVQRELGDVQGAHTLLLLLLLLPPLPLTALFLGLLSARSASFVCICFSVSLASHRRIEKGFFFALLPAQDLSISRSLFVSSFVSPLLLLLLQLLSSLSSLLAAMAFDKIKVENPIVEMDGMLDFGPSLPPVVIVTF
jgi:hypothetical protein